MKTLKTHRRKGRTKFKDSFYVRMYEYARDGLSKKEIANAFGINFLTVLSWVKSNPVFKEAFDKGRACRGTNMRTKFRDYVYKHLPEHLHTLWDEICAADDPGGGAEKKIAALTRECGRKARQYLWVHALVSSNFNYNEACRRSGINRLQVERWTAGNADFAELLEHIQEMKKDFVEGCLLNLVGQGDTTATIFSAKTLLRDRGYDPKLTVEHTGTVKHAHMSIETVLNYLPVETKRQVLDAMRQAVAGEAPPKMLTAAQAVEEFENVEDAEFEEVDNDI